jgi:hypothetical protein
MIRKRFLRNSNDWINFRADLERDRCRDSEEDYSFAAMPGSFPAYAVWFEREIYGHKLWEREAFGEYILLADFKS